MLATLLVLGVAPSVYANGRFPSVDQLVVEPGNPDHLVLRTTFGLLASKDRGGAWDFLCEDALGYKDADPALAVLEGGRVLLGLVDGVSVSDEAGCTFERATGIDGRVIDLTVALGEPGTAYAATIPGTATVFWQTTDGGTSFSPLGDEVPNFTATTLDTAPNHPELIYAAGLLGTRGGFLRSEDRGKSFVTFVVPEATSARRPYIAGIDPTDERTVYVRTEGLPGLLFVTRDGGEHFTRILALDIPVQGFALSPDGRTIVASNPYDGIYRAQRDDFAFERVACKGPSCLVHDDGVLFGCGDNYVDGYIVGRSSDLGESFQRVADFGCLEGAVACGASSGAGALCPAVWPMIEQQLGGGVCAPVEVVPDRSCFPASGAAGESGAGGEAGGSNGAGGSAGRTGAGGAGRGGRAGTGGGGLDGGAGAAATGGRPSSSPPAGSGGCACRVGSISGVPSPLASILALIAASFARRATRRAKRPTPSA